MTLIDKGCYERGCACASSKDVAGEDGEVVEVVSYRELSVFISCHAKNKDFYRVLTPESANLKLTFDGETGELKSAEVLK